MKRVPILMASAVALLLFLAAACVSEVAREGTAAPIATPVTQAPTSTFTPPPPTMAAPTVPPTPVPTLPSTIAPPPTVPPTKAPTSVPTEEPAPMLVLEVRAPRDGSTVRTDAVVVYGITLPSAFVDINGVIAEVGPDGRFQAEISLEPGLNSIDIVASDSFGNQESFTLNLTSLALPPQPFLLIVTEPKDQSIVSEESIRISGRTGPDAIASVNGVSVSVDQLGFFFAVVDMEPGPNIIEVVATNNDGTVLSTVIALIYRP